MAIDVDSADRKLTVADEVSTAFDPESDQSTTALTHYKELSTDQDDGSPQQPVSRVTIATGVAIVAILSGLVGWLAYGAQRLQHEQAQRNVLLQVARQCALNLTTISYTEADADVKRILDSATGRFHDDFQSRAQPFIDVVKQAQSKSEGSIVEAGLESARADHAQALIAVNVNTSLGGTPEPQPRAWRMRITVERVGDDVKASNVEFVQ